jgi:hypothetical protein
MIDRATWIRDLRRLNEQQESGLADDYDAYWGEIEDTHRAFIDRFLRSSCPRAACSTQRAGRAST